MHIELISIGKVKQKFILAGEQEYIPRIKALSKFKLTELKVSETPGNSPEQRRVRDSEALFKHIKPGACIIMLDERGIALNSKELASYLQDKMVQGRSQFCFAIGGAFGWDEKARRKADLLLSLSALTLPYQLTRLLITEQIYRILTMIKGQPYHKE